MSSRPAAAAAALAAGLIGLATLLPSAGPTPEAAGLCVLCGERALADALLNVLLFVPFGAALAGAGVRPAAVVLAGAAFTLGIELAQQAIPGRDPSLGDALWNTLGAALGGSWRRLLRVGRVRLAAGLRAPLAAALVAAALAGTAALLRPAWTTAAYYGQWTPRLGHLEPYHGRVLEARLGGRALPDGRLDDTDAVRRMLRDGAPLRVLAVAGPAPAGLAPIFAIHDADQREVLLLGADGDDAVFRYRTRAAALQLDQPDVRLPGALESVRPGDPLELRVVRRGSAFCIAVGTAGAATCGPAAPRLTDGWTVLLYAEWLPTALRDALGLLWIAGLFAVPGALLRGRGEAAAVAGAALAAVAGLPALLGYPPATPEETVAALLGLALGRAAAHPWRRRDTAVRSAHAAAGDG